MEVREQLFINGAWVSSTGTGRIDVVDSTSEEVMGTIPRGTVEDVSRAAGAASEAFWRWSSTSVEERSKMLARVQEALSARSSDIATLISKEVGMPFALSKIIQVGLPVASFATMSQIVRDFPFEEEIGNSLVVREPAGVVGCITPWNYPLHQISAKVAPALAAGCTVVLKPSVVAPLSAFALAEVFEEVGLPPGVFNLVTGPGGVVGEAISSSPSIDMVSFTGSTDAGKRVMRLAAETVKRVALELGGKSANVILEDADLSKAVPAALSACYLNSGQTCSALTRMIVPRSRLAEVEELAVAAAETYKTGDPFDPATRLGPLVSADQRLAVRGYIKKGVEEGAKLLCGGAQPPDGLKRGYYVLPTVFSEVSNDMSIAREEIFGPVLSIIPYETEEEAISIANDTIYGLAGGVWAGDKEHAQRVARKLRTGQVEVNGGAFNPVAPFGGYKQSGVGRELGRYGLEEFLEVKAIQR
jgi:acyl-CoA reductase-like NAD-dependent aldehyde dehydrogenase